MNISPKNADITGLSVSVDNLFIASATISGRFITVRGKDYGSTTIYMYYYGSYLGEFTVNVGNMADGMYHIVSWYNSGSYNFEVISATANLRKSSDNHSLNQLWYVQNTGSGYTIQNVFSGKYLAHTASPASGNSVTQSTNSGSANVKWTFTQSGSGYIIRPANSSTLSINAAGSGSTVNLTDYSGTGTNNKWLVYSADVNMIGTVSHDGHDHTTCLYSARNSLINNPGYASGTHLCVYDNVYPTVQNAIDIIENSKIFVLRGEGDNDFSSRTTKMYLDDISNTAITASDINGRNLNGVEIAIFAGKKSSYSSLTYTTISEVAVLCGANYAIGFGDVEECQEISGWVADFFYQYSLSENVLESFNAASSYYYTIYDDFSYITY